MELFVIRHAKTLWNLEGRYQGSTDIPLADVGRQEALTWRAHLPPRPDFLWSSPLARARETATILYPNQMIQFHDGLKEMHVGEWEGKTTTEVQGLFEGDWRGMDFAGHGGESFREVVARVKDWLESLPEASGKIAVVVTHKATTNAFYSLATGWDASYKPKERLSFPSIHKFRWEARKLSVLELNISLQG